MDQMQHLANQYADIERRLRQLEGGQRSGLASIQVAGTQPAQVLDSYGANNWSNLGGNAPEVTLETGSRVVLLASFRPVDVTSPITYSPGGEFKSWSIHMGLGIDSLQPQEIPSPTTRSNYAMLASSDSAEVLIQHRGGITLTTFRDDLTPGEHTFKMLFYADLTNPAGTIDPSVDDMALIVIPLGFA